MEDAELDALAEALIEADASRDTLDGDLDDDDASQVGLGSVGRPIVRVCGTLAGAKEQRQFGERVFAVDAQRHAPARVTKQFVPATIGDAVASQLGGAWPGRGTLYEVVPPGEPARFYIDVDLVFSRSVGAAAHAWALGVVARGMHAWLGAVWGGAAPRGARGMEVAEACAGARFSAHIVTHTYVTDAPVQARSAFASFATFLSTYVEDEQTGTGSLVAGAAQRSPHGGEVPPDELQVVSRELTEAARSMSLVDGSVYAANQQLRVLGSAKLQLGRGGVRPLCSVNCVVAGPRRRYEFVRDKAAWRAALTPADVQAAMVVPGRLWGEAGETRRAAMLYFDVPCALVARAQARERQRALTTPARQAGITWETCPEGVARAARIPSDSLVVSRVDGARVLAGAAPGEEAQFAARVSLATAEAVVARAGLSGGRYCVDGDEVIIAADGPRMASELVAGAVVFCPHCETLERRVQYGGVLRVGGRGKPSATVCRAPGHWSLAIKCWNAVCNKVTSIVNVDAAPMADVDVTIPRSELPGGYLALHTPFTRTGFRLPGAGQPLPRYITLDAPMGCGKTRAVMRYVEEEYPRGRVLFPTFRQGLARKLARDAKIDCYLDKGWNEARVAICLNSLLRISSVPYDLVVIDEAMFVLAHLVGATFTEEHALAVLAHLARILGSAKRVIVMQHGLTGPAVEWWRVLVNATRQESLHVRVDGTLPLRPALVLSGFPGALGSPPRMARLCEYIAAAYLDHAAARTTTEIERKIFVPVSTRHLALTVYAALCTAADEYNKTALVPLDRGRIKVVYAGHNKEWAADFQGDPATYGLDVDVLIATPVLQAGVSVGPHFKTLIAVMPHGVLTHQQEIQLTMRLRMANAEGLTPWSLLYVEHGVTGRLIVPSQQNVEGDTYSALMGPSLLRVALRMARAERNDSFCRHLQLWRRDYARAEVPFTEFTDAWGDDRSAALMQQVASRLHDGAQLQPRYDRILEGVRGRVPEMVAWAHSYLTAPGAVDWDAPPSGGPGMLAGMLDHGITGLFDEGDAWLHSEPARAFARVVRDKYTWAADCTPALLAFGTSPHFVVPAADAVHTHRQRARVLAAALVRFAEGEHTDQMQQHAVPADLLALDAAPFLQWLLTATVVEPTPGGFRLVAKSRLREEATTHAWLVRHTATPSERDAFATLLREVDAAHYANARATRDTPWQHAASKLLQGAGLGVAANKTHFVLDEHAFFSACVACVAWLGAGEAFFARVFARFADHDDVLRRMRVYVAACALAGLVGPWHGVHDRSTLNSMLQQRIHANQLGLVDCSVVRGYLGVDELSAAQRTELEDGLRGVAANREWRVYGGVPPHARVDVAELGGRAGAPSPRTAWLALWRTPHLRARLVATQRVTRTGRAYAGYPPVFTKVVPAGITVAGDLPRLEAYAKALRTRKAPDDETPAGVSAEGDADLDDLEAAIQADPTLVATPTTHGSPLRGPAVPVATSTPKRR